MQALVAKEKAFAWIRGNSGLEPHRPYLGMSQIGRCPRLLYHQFFEGNGAHSDRAHIHCFSGYLYQGAVLRILAGAGLADPLKGEREIVAAFDSRFRGHTDGETTDGELLEIKSMSAEDYGQLVKTRRLPDLYFDQVQTYMRHGDYASALVVAVSRDSFDLFFLTVPRNDRAGERIDCKARMILAAIDARRPPHCTCGRCQ